VINTPLVNHLLSWWWHATIFFQQNESRNQQPKIKDQATNFVELKKTKKYYLGKRLSTTFKKEGVKDQTSGTRRLFFYWLLCPRNLALLGRYVFHLFGYM
jgi:hypothetical protein